MLDEAWNVAEVIGNEEARPVGVSTVRYSTGPKAFLRLKGVVLRIPIMNGFSGLTEGDYLRFAKKPETA